MMHHHAFLFRLASTVGLCWLAIAGHGRKLKADDRPVVIVDAPVSGHIHPSICRTMDGTLIVVFKGTIVLMWARSTDGGQSWEWPVPIANSQGVFFLKIRLDRLARKPRKSVAG